MLPGNTLFGGMYGVIIIENNIEASLKGTTLPDDANTHTLALSDIDFDATGVVGKQFGMPATTKKLMNWSSFATCTTSAIRAETWPPAIPLPYPAASSW